MNTTVKDIKLPGDNPVLIGYRRGNHWDAILRGAYALVNDRGKVLASEGDIKFKHYPRSSEKPAQALAVLLSGAAEKFDFTDEEVVVTSASHNSEDEHIRVVRNILKKIGLDESSLQCGIQKEYKPDLMLEWGKKGVNLTPILNNCSGKHAGMLALAVQIGADIKKYHLAESPVQEYIKNVLSRLTLISEKDLDHGIDGCGVPVHALSVYETAFMYARLTSKMPEGFTQDELRHLERLNKAVGAYPFMIGGTKRLCTSLNALDGKLLAKGGAEGVYCFGVQEKGVGFALKLDSGRDGYYTPLVVEVVCKLGILTKKEENRLRNEYMKPLKNCRKEDVSEPILFNKDIPAIKE